MQDMIVWQTQNACMKMLVCIVFTTTVISPDGFDNDWKKGY